MADVEGALRGLKDMYGTDYKGHEGVKDYAKAFTAMAMSAPAKTREEIARQATAMATMPARGKPGSQGYPSPGAFFDYVAQKCATTAPDFTAPTKTAAMQALDEGKKHTAVVSRKRRKSQSSEGAKRSAGASLKDDVEKDAQEVREFVDKEGNKVRRILKKDGSIAYALVKKGAEDMVQDAKEIATKVEEGVTKAGRAVVRVWDEVAGKAIAYFEPAEDQKALKEVDEIGQQLNKMESGGKSRRRRHKAHTGTNPDDRSGEMFEEEYERGDASVSGKQFYEEEDYVPPPVPMKEDKAPRPLTKLDRLARLVQWICT